MYGVSFAYMKDVSVVTQGVCYVCVYFNFFWWGGGGGGVCGCPHEQK